MNTPAATRADQFLEALRSIRDLHVSTQAVLLEVSAQQEAIVAQFCQAGLDVDGFAPMADEDLFASGSDRDDGRFEEVGSSGSSSQ